MPTPVQTIYDGYHFRSRLEAKWAVFFKYSNIRYTYEPEGFALKNGTAYLPDFFLPDYNAYVEVKNLDAIKIGMGENSDEIFFESGTEDASKYAQFLIEIVKDSSYIILMGDPLDALGVNGNNTGYVFMLGECPGHLLVAEGEHVTNEEGKDCSLCDHYSNLLYFPFLGFSEEGILIALDRTAKYAPKDYKHCDAVFIDNDDSEYTPEREVFIEKMKSQVRIAQKARMARFEHNETP